MRKIGHNLGTNGSPESLDGSLEKYQNSLRFPLAIVTTNSTTDVVTEFRLSSGSYSIRDFVNSCLLIVLVRNKGYGITPNF